MKPKTTPKQLFPALSPLKFTLIILGLLMALSIQPLSAASIYWNGVGTGWDLVTDWSTVSGATTPNPGAVPGSGDDVFFNITTVNTAQTINLNAARSANSVTFTTTGAATVQAGGTDQPLTIGAGGITKSGTAAAATIGSGAAVGGQRVNLVLNGSQTWANNTGTTTSGGTGVTVQNGIAGNATAGTTNTLTIGGLNGGGNAWVLNCNTNPITDGLNGGSLAITFNTGASGNSGSVQIGAATGQAYTNTYSGGSILTKGRVNVNLPTNSTTPLGTGPVTVASGAQLFLNNGGSVIIRTVSENFFIAGTGTGGDQAGALRVDASTIFTGTITLTGDAAITPQNRLGSVIMGQITGPYNLTLCVPATGGGANGGGNITISNNANNWTGNTTIGIGTVILGQSEVIPSGAGHGNLIFNNTTTSIFDLHGFTNTVNGLSASGASVITNGAASASLLIVGANDAAGNTFYGLIKNGTGTLALTKIGAGTQSLGGLNTYTGNTVISNGTLGLVVNGSISNSPNIIIADGATFDLSGGASFYNFNNPYSLGPNQNILGGGTINNPGFNVVTASGSKIIPGTDGTVDTNTFNCTLVMTAGSTFNVDVSTLATSGNDQVIVNGALTLNSTTFNIKALGGGANLDQTADYVLVTASGGVTGTPILNWAGTAPANSSSYTIVNTGASVILHFNAVTPLSGVGSASPSSLVHNQTTPLSVTVTPASSPASTGIAVMVDASQIGGSASLSLVLSGAPNVYTNSVTVGANIAFNSYSLPVAITDAQSRSAASAIALTVLSGNFIWNGGSLTDDNWSSNPNWNGIAPGLAGDTVFFGGTTRLAPNVDNNYSVNSLTFNSGAGAFNIGSANGSTLTLAAGSITNNSATAETMSVPLALGVSQAINPAAANITLAGSISGNFGITNVGPNQLILSGTNTYTGGTLVSTGQVVLANAFAATATIVTVNTNGGLVFTGDTNFNLGGLAGSGSETLTNTAGNAVTIISSNVVQNINYAGTLSGSGSLIKNGIGDQNFATAATVAPNNYSGGTIINAGRISLTTTNATVGSGNVTVASGAELYLAVATVVTNSFFISGDGGNATDTQLRGAIRMDNGLLAGGTITLLADASIGGNNNGTGVINDPISGAFNLSIIKSGANNPGTIVLAGTNGLTGTTTVVNGHLRLANALALTNSTVTVNAANGLQFTNDTAFTLGGLAGTATFGLTNLVGNAVALTVGNNNSNSSYSGAMTGSGTLNKIGTGTLTLGGVNTYTGLTTVSNGTILLRPAFSTVGDIVVNAGKTLGAVNEGTSVSAQLVNLNVGAGASATLLFSNVLDTVTPLINVAGTLTASAGSTIKVQADTNLLVIGTVYPLVKYGTLSGSFALSMPAGTTGSLTNDTSNNWIALNFTGFSSVNTTPTNITTVLSGNTLTLSWPADYIGWRLQSQTNSLSVGLSTNWTDVAGSTTTNQIAVPINSANGAVFFRMIYP